MGNTPALDLLQHSLILALLICAPMLVIGLVVGLIISVVQAVTQIQEQTLTFVPKIASMLIAAVVLLPWLSTRLVDYVSLLWGEGRVP